VDSETFIARQPIFDARIQVQGYELLHRSGWTNAFEGGDPDQATVEVLNGSLLVNRFQDLTDGKRGYINVPRNVLVQDFLELLPPELAVIEVLETVGPEPEVLAAMRRLRRKGYTIALDDFVDPKANKRLLQLADIIKVDFKQTGSADREALVECCQRPGLVFLAEKVETHKEFEEAKSLGFELFQGYFFCKPETTVSHDLPRSTANYIELLKEVMRDELNLGRLERVIQREQSLSAKLLRYINSIHFGVQDEILSIKQALIHLGERPLRRWGMLMALAGIGEGKPNELVRTCLVRARFCETLSREANLDADSLDLYLTGMFSGLDALVDRPLDLALEQLGLNPDIGAAIRGDGSGLSSAFGLAVACEQGDWGLYTLIAEQLGLERERVAQLYARALFWADQLFVRGKEAA
jgi:c-di-GMP-related signal transduction protein